MRIHTAGRSPMLFLTTVLALAAGTAGCGRTTPEAGPTGTATPAGATPSTTTHSAATPSAGTAAAADCRASDLAFQTDTEGLAAGNRYDEIIMVNHAATACRLAGAPRLLHTDGSGQVTPVPATPEDADRPAETVAPGDTAHFSIHTVNGYAGYDPSSPHCAHPAVYTGLLLELPGGRIPLGDVKIDVKCDGVSVTGWGWPRQ